ncbi:MAG: thioredoxin-disulfide reductase [Kiloniellales bacterium]
MSETKHAPVLIIGSGAAGLTAAIYAARAGMKPVVVEGIQPGGQMTITTDVENYPGFADVIQGPWLMEQMKLQAQHVGTEIVSDIVVEIDLSRRPFRATGDSGTRYSADAVIVATGAQARWLGLPSEKHYGGRGVSACATCDGFFYRGKKVAVVGGGNSAVEEALYLANLCEKVTLIHRRDALRAEKIGQERLFANPKVEVIWDSTAEEILGGPGPMDGVTGLRIRNVKTGKTSELALDGVFVAIGHDPATGIFRGKLKMDSEGYILAKPNSTETDVAGVFAAGDCVDKVYRQAVTAAGLGCMAALQAEKFLAAHASQTAAAE